MLFHIDKLDAASSVLHTEAVLPSIGSVVSTVQPLNKSRNLRFNLKALLGKFDIISCGVKGALVLNKASYLHSIKESLNPSRVSLSKLLLELKRGTLAETFQHV